LTLGAALKDDNTRDAATAAIRNEIDSMIQEKVMTPILHCNIPAVHRKYVIPAHMFFKEKFRSDGTFDKLKARLVAIA
jgi:hypothetical protein